MSNANFMQIKIPDFYIKIGVRDNKVVAIDWSDALPKTCSCSSCQKDVLKNIKKYLKGAVRFFEKDKVELK